MFLSFQFLISGIRVSNEFQQESNKHNSGHNSSLIHFKTLENIQFLDIDFEYTASASASASNHKASSISNDHCHFNLHTSFFANFSHIRRLFLKNCDFFQAKEDVFRTLTNLEVLDLDFPRNSSHIKIENLPKLKSLRFFNTSDENIPVFQHANPDLEILELNLKGHIKSLNLIQKCCFPKLKIFCFRGTDHDLNDFHLDWLSEQTQMKNSPTELFSNTSCGKILENFNIKSICLETDDISSIKGKFSIFTSLQSLKLKGNYSFDHLARKLFHISHDDEKAARTLQRIDCDLFHDLRYLENLDLRENGIVSIKKKAFRELFGLRFLDLSYNNLTHIEPRMFFHTPNLAHLNLSNNHHIRIKKKTFSYLNRLKSLNLADCSIEFLDEKTFRSLVSLEVLDLSMNPRMKIKRILFKELTNLKKLYLTSDSIFCTPVDFSNLNSLERVLFDSISCDLFMEKLKNNFTKIEFDYQENH